MSGWHLSGKPYKVQLEALERASGRMGFAYFLEQGLGKTAVVLNEFIDLYCRDMVHGLVVVCPNSLKTNWKKEAQDWGVQVPVFIWPERVDIKREEPFIFVINIEAVIFGGGEYLETLIGSCPTMGVIDESIIIKNPQASRTKRMLGLAGLFKYRRVLSGAPMTQSPLDLWAQLKFIGELHKVASYVFRNTYCKMGGFMNKQIVGIQNEAELRRLMNRCSLVAKKADWTDLPNKLHTYRHVQLTAAQHKAYEEMFDDFLTTISDTEVTAPIVLTQLMKLQQIGCGFAYADGEVVEIMPAKDNPKVKAVLEILDETDSKVLIFAVHKHSIRMLQSIIPNSLVLQGQMAQADIAEVKRKFNEEDKWKVLICQTHAAKYGHTLLGTKTAPCHTTVFFENDYSLDARLQAEDRNHRHGQHYPVTYHDVISAMTDELAINALTKKQSVADSIVGALRALDKDRGRVV